MTCPCPALIEPSSSRCVYAVCRLYKIIDHRESNPPNVSGRTYRTPIADRFIENGPKVIEGFADRVNLDMLPASGAHMQRRVDELSRATSRSSMTTPLSSKAHLSCREESVDQKFLISVLIVFLSVV
jgi:hypothetical protein